MNEKIGPQTQRDTGNGSSGTDQQEGLYKTPEDAKESVSKAYDDWSGNLSTTSLQMCYALIAANWTIFGSVNGILRSDWAKWSILMVLVALASSVIGSGILSELLRRRVNYAEADYPRWDSEFRAAYGKEDPWPYTELIDSIGASLRWIKAGLTLISGLLLVIGALRK